MSDTSTLSGGLLQSVRRLADTGLALLHNRAELFAVELQEEKSHLIEILLWVAVLLFFGILSVLVLTATLIMLASEGTRIYVAGGLSLVYLVGAVWAWLRLKARLETRLPFAQTITEVKKDRDWLFDEQRTS